MTADFRAFTAADLRVAYRDGETLEIRHAAFAELCRRTQERIRSAEYARRVNAAPHVRLREMARSVPQTDWRRRSAGDA